MLPIMTYGLLTTSNKMIQVPYNVERMVLMASGFDTVGKKKLIWNL